MIERIRKYLEISLGIIIIVFAVWGFFYSFHILPFGVNEDFGWWYIPQFITSAAVAICIIMFGSWVVDQA